jgi:hypothetical protein
VDAIGAALRAEPGCATRVVNVGGDRLTVADHVVVRAFETWIHARDIAGLAGVPVPAPSGRHLRPMAELAARVLDYLLSRSMPGTAGGPGAVQLTLTGPGGGSWPVGFGTRAAAPASDGPAPGPHSPARRAEVVVDAIEFCLLVADRRAPGELEVVITGDDGLAGELLTLAPLLARP